MINVSPRITIIELPAGCLVIDSNQPCDALYRITSGAVRIEPLEGPPFIAGPGDFIGEAALVPGSLPGARAVTATTVELAKIARADLDAVLGVDAKLSLALARSLAAQLATLHNAANQSTVMMRASADPGHTLPPMFRAPPDIASALRELAAVPRSSGWRLRNADTVIPLPLDRGGLLIGRPDPTTNTAPDVDLSPLDMARGLSRRHARVWLAAEGATLREEPRVANGTWVNNRRLNPGESVVLKAGDRLRFGAVEVTFDQA